MTRITDRLEGKLLVDNILTVMKTVINHSSTILKKEIRFQVPSKIYIGVVCKACDAPINCFAEGHYL